MSSASSMCQTYPVYTSDAPEDVSTALHGSGEGSLCTQGHASCHMWVPPVVSCPGETGFDTFAVRARSALSEPRKQKCRIGAEKRRFEISGRADGRTNTRYSSKKRGHVKT